MCVLLRLLWVCYFQEKKPDLATKRTGKQSSRQIDHLMQEIQVFQEPVLVLAPVEARETIQIARLCSANLNIIVACCLGSNLVPNVFLNRYRLPEGRFCNLGERSPPLMMN